MGHHAGMEHAENGAAASMCHGKVSCRESHGRFLGHPGPPPRRDACNGRMRKFRAPASPAVRESAGRVAKKFR